MAHLALLRHGQSEWNLQNRFTGWVDVNLTQKGEAEARHSGKLLAATGVRFNAAYTSVLTRAIRTLHIALDEANLSWLPETKDWRLNERHYGALTGLDKAETAEKHGADQVKIWRRSYDVPPPPLADPRNFPSLTDARYPQEAVLPKSESLKDTLARVEPYWQSDIVPRVQAGENLIIAAHGNSLRALVKLLFKVSNDDILHVEIPTGNPLLLEVKEKDLSVISAKYLDQTRAVELPKL